MPRPGAINYGSASTGSTNHITGELLKTEAGIEMTHVPFKGGAPALLANQLELYIATTPEELRTLVLAEIQKMRRIVKNSGAKVD